MWLYKIFHTPVIIAVPTLTHTPTRHTHTRLKHGSNSGAYCSRIQRPLLNVKSINVKSPNAVFPIHYWDCSDPPETNLSHHSFIMNQKYLCTSHNINNIVFCTFASEKHLSLPVSPLPLPHFTRACSHTLALDCCHMDASEIWSNWTQHCLIWDV